MERLRRQHTRRRKQPGKHPAKRRGGRTQREVVIETRFESAMGSYQLQRNPVEQRQPLRAWDAADEYLLQYLVEHELLEHTAGSVLVLNDSFGAISLALHDYAPVTVNDSVLSREGIVNNLPGNGIDSGEVTVVHSLHDLRDAFPSAIKLAVIKVPRSNAMLEYQIHRLRPLLDERTVIIGAGMTRHIHNSTLDAFSSIIGDTRSTIARKKARLIISTFDAGLEPGPCAYPVEYELDIGEGRPIRLVSHAAVFSAARLDDGSRLMIEHMPGDEGPATIIDLGCGNGVLGIVAAIRNPAASLLFADDSYMAVESARINFSTHFADMRDAEFRNIDCLQGVAASSADLVLCNPPFHQDNIVTDQTAWRMFLQSREKLAPGGELWVVGNRHLAYHAKLKHLFGNCTTIASDRRFSLLKSIRSAAGGSGADRR